MNYDGKLYIKGKYSSGKIADAFICTDSILGALNELSHYVLTMTDDNTTEIKIVIKRKGEN